MSRIKHPLLLKAFYNLVRIIDNIKSTRWEVGGHSIAR